MLRDLRILICFPEVLDFGSIRKQPRSGCEAAARAGRRRSQLDGQWWPDATAVGGRGRARSGREAARAETFLDVSTICKSTGPAHHHWSHSPFILHQ